MPDEPIAAAPAAEAPVEVAPVDIVDEAAPAESDAAAPAADTSAEAPAAADDKPAEVQSVSDFIRQGLAELDEIKAGNTETTDEPDSKPKSDADAENTEDKEKPKETEEPAKADESDDDKDPKEEPAKAKIIPEVEFRTRAQIDTDFDRVPKEAREVMATYAEAGKQMQATLESLGGEPYMAPLQKIVEGMEGDNNLPMFSGMLEAVGIERFADYIDDTMLLACVETLRNEPTNDGERFFVDKLKDTARKVLQAQFGDDVTYAHLKKLVTYDRGGHLNTADVDKYFEENPDEDPAKADPVLREKDDRILELETKLAEAEGKGEQTAQTQQAVDFDKDTSTHTHGVLEDMLFKKSVLKGIATDDEVLAAAKKAARKLIRTEYDANITGNKVYARLKSGNLKGEASTSKYQRDFSTLVGKALMQARETAEPIEALISLVYGGKRNVEIRDREQPAGDENGNGNHQPTMTTQREGGKDPSKMSEKEWREYLKEQLEPVG